MDEQFVFFWTCLPKPGQHETAQFVGGFVSCFTLCPSLVTTYSMDHILKEVFVTLEKENIHKRYEK